MTGEERRAMLLDILKKSEKPVSGTSLSTDLKVSRQIVVQDIALLRAAGHNVYSTNRGYLLKETDVCSRVFKVYHTDEETEKELCLYVDNGGVVQDVFVYHKVYGMIKADMQIKSRRDVKTYMENIASGKSSLLKNVTSGYHYHTIVADSEETLDLIQEELVKAGFLAKLQEYEPVDFWG